LGKQLPRLLSKKLTASLFPNVIETFTPFAGCQDEGDVSRLAAESALKENIVHMVM